MPSSILDISKIVKDEINTTIIAQDKYNVDVSLLLKIKRFMIKFIRMNNIVNDVIWNK